MAFTDFNADGEPAVEPTCDQKYIFDVKGWIAFPGVLADDDIEEMREFCLKLKTEPESVPEPERCGIGGPLLKLADHPIVLGFMNEFVACGNASQECYGFRMESSFVTQRKAGSDNFQPHGGGGLNMFPANSHVYHLRPGEVHSGLTRVVWEMNPVEEGCGGTLFVSGSHKAAFHRPDSLQDPQSPLWDTYSCPAGSLLIFTEAITHTGTEWKTKDRHRLAIFNSYNTMGSKWHKWEPHPDLLAKMCPKRQSLFRPVYCEENPFG